ncbi:MAG: hypothetical protein RL383_1313, partial [Actinomycetota bacterium]
MTKNLTNWRRIIPVITLGAAAVLAGCGADPTDLAGSGPDGGSVTAEPTNKITGSVRE